MSAPVHRPAIARVAPIEKAARPVAVAKTGGQGKPAAAKAKAGSGKGFALDLTHGAADSHDAEFERV
jgi:hypothetical protein